MSDFDNKYDDEYERAKRRVEDLVPKHNVDDTEHEIYDVVEDYYKEFEDIIAEDVLEENEEEYMEPRRSYYPYKRFMEYRMDPKLFLIIDNANVYPFGMLHPDTEMSLFFKYHSQTHYIYTQLMLNDGDKTIMSNLRMGSNYRGIAFDLIRKYVIMSIERSLYNYFKYLYDNNFIPVDEMNVLLRHKYPETRYMPDNMAGIILDSIIHGKAFTKETHMSQLVQRGVYNTPMKPMYRDGKIVFQYGDASMNTEPIVLDVEIRNVRGGILSLEGTEMPFSDGKYTFRTIDQYVWFNVYKMFIDDGNAYKMSEQAFRYRDYEGIFENEVLFNYTSIRTQEAFADILGFVETEATIDMRNDYLGFIKSIPYSYKIVDNYQVFGTPISLALTHLHNELKRNLMGEASIPNIPFIRQNDLERKGKLTRWIYNIQVPTMISMFEVVYKYIQFHSSQTNEVLEHLYAPLHLIRQENKSMSVSLAFPKEFHAVVKQRLRKNEALWDVLTENDQNESLYDMWATIVQLYDIMPTKLHSNELMTLNKSMNTALIMRLKWGDVERMYVSGFKNFTSLKRRLRNQLMSYSEYRKLLRELCGMDMAVRALKRAKLSITESPRVTKVVISDKWQDYIPVIEITEPELLSVDTIVDIGAYEQYIRESIMFIEVDASQMLKDILDLYNFFQYGKLRDGVDIVVPVFSRMNLVTSNLN